MAKNSISRLLSADTLCPLHGDIYVSDSGNHYIRMITLDGTLRTIAGIPGKPGFADGPCKGAQFNGPRAIAFDRRGNLIVADRANHRIRKVILP
jgi:hypothetical protein